MRSRNLFVNLRQSVPLACAENFVTEALSWIVSVHAHAAQGLIGLALPKQGDGTSWTWRTQVYLGDALDCTCPDMVAESETHVVLFENKIDAPIDDAQLRAHRRIATAVTPGRSVALVLLSRQQVNDPPVDANITWIEVQRAMKTAAAREDPTNMIGQFVEFLGMEGLGRVPGPCPTFWKASILEAKRRDASKGMARGYFDLGAKFAHSVLPHAMEDLAADQEGSDEALRQALGHALHMPQADRAVWHVCRRFFPSYFFRVDPRLGSLRVNDRQGMAFARGLIAAVREDGLP